MPFSAEVKTLMFIRCGRLCCLCLKPCGVNIEAAHIHAEGKGGSNDDENGIPVCFDCHQEMESYNDDHPKGNKFRPSELIARRDRVYRLVESGAVYAQVVARQLRRSSPEPTDAEIEESVEPPAPTAEAKRLLDMLASKSPPEAPDRKIKLLSPKGQAFVLDRLLKEAPGRPTAVTALCRAATRNLLSEDDQRVTVEQLVRSVTLFGTAWAKAALFEALSPEVFAEVAEELRLALLDDVVHLIKHDQFDEVNELVPALEAHIAAVPSELHADFVMALLDQARSRSHQGAPSARRMLASLPEGMAKPALPLLDRKFLEWYGREKFVRTFVRDFGKFADPIQRPMLDDLLTLSDREFQDKYHPHDF